MSLALSGIGVSRGIAIGKAHVLQQEAIEVQETRIPTELLEVEIQRFEYAIHTARQQLRSIRTQIPTSTRPDIVEFIDTHLLMLEDSMLAQVPVQFIREFSCNAEWALKLQRDELAAVFDEMDDPYLRTRKDDVDHVINRVLRILATPDAQEPGDDTTNLHNAIIFACDLTPADTVLLYHQGIAAFVTEYGGPLSHTAILARSLGVPAIVGAHNVQRYIRDGETVILDGQQGMVLAGVDEPILEHYYQRQSQEQLHREELAKLKTQEAITRDGVRVSLMANIELPEDVTSTLEVAAEGIGLYRTEFLFMNRPDTPSEEEQLTRYLEIIDALKGRTVTIRTLDLGADKKVDSGPTVGRRSSSNPALGLRAIRLCLKDLDLFRPQLRAILRASAHGPARMMIPMLSTQRELAQVLNLIEETKQQLAREGKRFDPHIPIGGMIEIPAAALAAPCFAAKLDFLSIGTNDLIQYTLAIDRIDDEVAYLYDPLHPSVLKLIQMTIEAGRAAGIPVGMCGEMAGDPRLTRLLLGMGLTEFSMHPSSLLEVKERIKTSTAADAAAQVEMILACGDPHQIESRLDQLNRDT